MPNIEVSTSTIDRLLDGHGYSVKLLTQRPVDRNRADVKQLRRRYAQWLQSEGTTLTRYYIDETNFNVWCSRSFGRAKRGISKKEHRRALLVEAAGRSMQHIQRVDCAAYDRHNYTFVQAALDCLDM
ncbi:hypothetical protein HPB52_024816 [Rhipicephalus sanguineus]|nr:hypothetical protein HPB52_024816 [Rhipicephalus sanguineus]